MKAKLFIILLFVGLFSCTKDFEEINTNPNNPVKVEPEYLFTTSLRQALDLYGGSMNRIVFFNYTHHFSGFNGTFQRYNYDLAGLDTYWRDTYVRCLQPVNQIIKLYEGNAAYNNRVIIAKIWMAYLYSNAVTMWGPIPFTQALTGDPLIAFDNEPDVYYALMDLLKELVSEIDLTADKYASGSDKIYGGDLLKWKKFANTLRLRLAMRISNSDATAAQTVATEVSLEPDGIISSMSNTAAMKWGITSDQWSHLYDRVVVNYAANKATIPVLCESMAYHMLPYNDSRIAVYAQPAKQGPHKGEYFGQNVSYGGGGEYAGGLVNPHTGLLQDDYSYLGTRFLLPDAEYIFLSYAEACFLKAEAAFKGWWSDSNAEQYYYEGIDASYNYYGLEPSLTTAYKNTPGIQWGTQTDSIGRPEAFQDWLRICDSYIEAGDYFRQIVMQHWLAIPIQGIDAWALIRRTRKLEFQPQFSTYDGELAYIPDRLPYPGSEATTNPVELEKAIGWLDGSDGLFTKLWFSLPNVPNPHLPK